MGFWKSVWDGLMAWETVRTVSDPNAPTADRLFAYDYIKATLAAKARRQAKETERDNAPCQSPSRNIEDESASRRMIEGMGKPPAILLCERALILGKEGDHRQAIAALNEAIRLEPDCGLIYYFRGKAYNQLGNKQQYGFDSEEWAKAHRPLTPHVEPTRDVRSYYEQAVVDLTEALRLGLSDTLYPEAYYNRAGLYHDDLKQYENALADYTECLRRDPQYADAHRRRADLLRLLGQAVQGPFLAAQKDTSMELSAKISGLEASGNGQPTTCNDYSTGDQEIIELTERLQRDPADIAALCTRGWSWLGWNEPYKALGDFDQAIRLNANCAEAYGGRANAHHMRGDDHAAIADYKKALQFDSEEKDWESRDGLAERCYRQAEFHEAKGDFDQAISYYDIVNGADTSNGYFLEEVLVRRGQAFFQKADFARAADDFTNALDRMCEDDPKELAEVLRKRGRCFVEIGKPEEGIADFLEAGRLDPLPATEISFDEMLADPVTYTEALQAHLNKHLGQLPKEQRKLHPEVGKKFVDRMRYHGLGSPIYGHMMNLWQNIMPT